MQNVPFIEIYDRNELTSESDSPCDGRQLEARTLEIMVTKWAFIIAMAWLGLSRRASLRIDIDRCQTKQRKQNCAPDKMHTEKRRSKKNCTNHKYWATSDPTTERLCTLICSYRYRYASRTYIYCAFHNQQVFVSLLLEPISVERIENRLRLSWRLAMTWSLYTKKLAGDERKSSAFERFNFMIPGSSSYAGYMLHHNFNKLQPLVRCCCVFMSISLLSLSLLLLLFIFSRWYCFAFDDWFLCHKNSDAMKAKQLKRSNEKNTAKWMVHNEHRITSEKERLQANIMHTVALWKYT